MPNYSSRFNLGFDLPLYPDERDVLFQKKAKEDVVVQPHVESFCFSRLCSRRRRQCKLLENSATEWNPMESAIIVVFSADLVPVHGRCPGRAPVRACEPHDVLTGRRPRDRC